MLQIPARTKSFFSYTRASTAHKRHRRRFIPCPEGLEARALLSVISQTASYVAFVNMDGILQNKSDNINQVSPNITPINFSAASGVVVPGTGESGSAALSFDSAITQSGSQGDAGTMSAFTSIGTSASTLNQAAENSCTYGVIGHTNQNSILTINYNSSSSSTNPGDAFNDLIVSVIYGGGTSYDFTKSGIYTINVPGTITGGFGVNYSIALRLSSGHETSPPNQPDPGASAMVSSSLSWRLATSQTQVLAMNSASITPDGQNVNATYTITGGTLPSPGTIDFYWATGPNLSDELPTSTTPVKVPTATQASSAPYTAHTSIASLGPRPSNAGYILAVADSPNADPAHYVVSTALPFPPQIVLQTVVKRDSKDVTLNYTMAEGPSMQAIGFDIYESDKPDMIDNSSIFLGQPTANLSQGSNQVTLPLDNAIVMDPARPYIVVVADADGSVTLADGSQTVVSGLNAFTPEQIRTAYGINELPTNMDGNNQTIAIVVYYNNPNIYQYVDSFDQTFGARSSGPTLLAQYGTAQKFLKVVDQKGNSVDVKSTDIPVDPSGAFEREADLDVEWAHAIAPGASIVLVECYPNSIPLSLFYYQDQLPNSFTGIKTAASIPTVSVVSISFGDYWNPDDPIIAQYWKSQILRGVDSYFSTPSNHQGVTFVASAGEGFERGLPELSYPALSPNVVTVGGTTLNVNADDSYNSEAAWTYTNFGDDPSEPEPTYQMAVQHTGNRAYPDVAFEADNNPNLGAYEYHNSGWIRGGGTSLSAPCWAGLIAIANQKRVALGGVGTTLDGVTQTLPALYGLPPRDFNPVNGIGNGARYDPITGLGTPRANYLIPDLASWNPRDVTQQVSATASGLVYNRATQLFGGSITLTNTGATNLIGTLEIVLTGLPAGVILANASGYTASGDPYILVDLSSGILAPGQSITLSIFFSNPKRLLFQYGIMAIDENS